MRLWARQHAWLSTCAKGFEVTRWSFLDRRGEQADFPDLGAFEYLPAWLMEVGPMQDRGPLTFTEIDAWSRLSGLPLKPFESQALRAMSQAYAAEVAASAGGETHQPYLADEEEDD